MELRGTWLASICGTTRQNIYMLEKSGKLTKSISGLYNIHDPKNEEFLLNHKKSVLDVKNFINDKEKNNQRPNSITNKQQPIKKNNDESIKLIKCVSSVIEKQYGLEASKKIKYEIMQEFQKTL
jgi:hypothetical protein